MTPIDRTERDGKWARRIQRGDHMAFRALFRAYAEPLCAFAERYTKSPEEAEELVQDLFFTIWKDRTRWRPDVSVKSYLYTAARNLALNYVRHEHTVAALKEEVLSHGRPAVEEPDQCFDRRRLRELVHQAVDELPKQCRHVFLLSRQHGLTYREIATVLDISPKTVETHMRRAFASLRQRLADHNPVGADHRSQLDRISRRD